MLIQNYIFAYFYSLIGAIATVYLYIQFINGTILAPSYYLIVALGAYVSMKAAKQIYTPLIRKMNLIMESPFVLLGVLYVSSIIYFKWSFEFLSASLVANVVLLVGGIGFLYLFLMLKRAMYVKLEKVKNPRLKEVDKKTYYTQLKQAEEHLSSDEPYFVLGIDVHEGEED